MKVKISEIEKLFDGVKINILNCNKYNFIAPEEVGSSFKENAKIPLPENWFLRSMILIKSSLWKNKINEIIDTQNNIFKNDFFIFLSNKKTERLVNG